MMDLASLLVFTGALFVAAASPGPGIAAIVARVLGGGMNGAVAFTAGVALGDVVWLTVAVLGLAVVAQTFQGVFLVIKYAGAAYLLYLAWRILRAGDPAGNGEARAQPLTLLEAAAFQWVNVKALTLAVGIVSAFTTVGGNQMAEVALIVAVFTLVMMPSLPIYVLFGVAIRSLLKSDRSRAIVNTIMAALVALSVVLLFI